MSIGDDFEDFDLRRYLRLIKASIRPIIGGAVCFAVLFTLLGRGAARQHTATARLERLRATDTVGALTESIPADEIAVLNSTALRDVVAKKMGADALKLPKLFVSGVGDSFIDLRVQDKTDAGAVKLLDVYVSEYLRGRRETATRDLLVGRRLAEQTLEATKTRLADLEKQLLSLPTDSRGALSDVLSANSQFYLAQQAVAEQRILALDTAIELGPVRVIGAPHADPRVRKGLSRYVGEGISRLLLGVGFSLLIMLIVQLARDRVRTRRDIGRTVPGLTIIGEIPSPATSRPTSPRGDLASGVPDAFRAAGAVLAAASRANGVSSVVLFGASRGSSPGTVAANLGYSMAEAGGRITLVDADLRQQELTGFFEASKEAPGLSDKLRDPTSAVPLLGVGPQGLALLPAGSGIVAPGAVLAAPGFARLIASLRCEGHLMIVSTSSPLGDSDIAAFSGTVGAAVIVVQAGKTSRRALAATVQRVVDHDIALLGAVLIDVKTKDLHDVPRSLSRTVEPAVTSNR